MFAELPTTAPSTLTRCWVDYSQHAMGRGWSQLTSPRSWLSGAISLRGHEGFLPETSRKFRCGPNSSRSIGSPKTGIMTTNTREPLAPVVRMIARWERETLEER